MYVFSKLLQNGREKCVNMKNNLKIINQNNFSHLLDNQAENPYLIKEPFQELIELACLTKQFLLLQSKIVLRHFHYLVLSA